MAFSTLKQCRSSMFARSLATSTTPRFATATTTTTAGMREAQGSRGGRLQSVLPAYGPMWAVIGIIGGMVGVAGCIGIHTAKQQLFHSPSVQVTKKRRESIPEVDDPDAIVQSSHKFTDKSFLRKVGHIQDNKLGRPDSYTRSKNVESLKSVGVQD